ncbi:MULTISPECIES: TadE/TadG family type IV pilus assembly protein [unclassified Nocardiopsis]|uniref:TadE/TadG family type IV pilus assembly protein n=1 Tax=unclassified Nocardiopsis TaxID=2649073 RepID=UPI001F4723F8|nr:MULTISPECIES: TadE/TadG family type IV pilus assembly protein [unclassified Nocardiopsis]
MTSPRDDRGSAEMAVAAPALLLLVMLVIQAALWMHGDHLVANIARRTAEQSRTADGGPAVADALGGAMLTDLDVSVDRGATEVNVTVQARVPSLIPGLTWPVRHDSSAPVERFVPQEGAP